MLWSSLACLLAFTGIFGLYLQWRTRWKSPLKNLFFWCVLIISCVCWILQSGGEFGLIYGAGVGGLLACLLAIAGGSYRPMKEVPEKPRRRIPASHHIWWRNAGYTILAVPVAGVAAAFSTLWVSSAFLMTPTNHIVSFYLVVPLVWGLFAYLTCAQRNLFRAAVLLLLFTVIPSAGLYWL